MRCFTASYGAIWRIVKLEARLEDFWGYLDYINYFKSILLEFGEYSHILFLYCVSPYHLHLRHRNPASANASSSSPPQHCLAFHPEFCTLFSSCIEIPLSLVSNSTVARSGTLRTPCLSSTTPPTQTPAPRCLFPSAANRHPSLLSPICRLFPMHFTICTRLRCARAWLTTRRCTKAGGA